MDPSERIGRSYSYPTCNSNKILFKLNFITLTSIKKLGTLIYKTNTMKKLIGIIAMAMLTLITTFAQTTAPAAKKATPAKTTKAVAKPAPVAGPTKKDGTADMRYKANKNAKVAGPKKKDGTADMRYKANKPVASKTATKKN